MASIKYIPPPEIYRELQKIQAEELIKGNRIPLSLIVERLVSKGLERKSTVDFTKAK